MVPYHIVASITRNYEIGIEGDLVYRCPEDLKRFYQITTAIYPEGPKNMVIMGYNTWISLPESVRPFRKRHSLVITQNHHVPEQEGLRVVFSLREAFEYCKEHTMGRIFVIGGETVFNECWTQYPHMCQTLYLTHFKDRGFPRGKGFSYFPHEFLEDTVPLYQSPSVFSACEVSRVVDLRQEEDPDPCLVEQSLIIHQRVCLMNAGETEYLKALAQVSEEGSRVMSRNAEVSSLFGLRMTFDLQEGFPLLTTKKMGYKTILRELLWFIKGSTDNRELQERKVHIWDQNASREFLESRGLDYEEGDLGPIYGFQWRHAGATYTDCHADYQGQGYDQLQKVLHLLQTDPHSRRIVMSSWNPQDLDAMALPPCHVLCQFYVREARFLDCQMYQRSGDMFLGVPFNIASYAFLTHILAKLTGYTAGTLIHVIGDAHLYETHREHAEIQRRRVPVAFPQITISEELTDIDHIQEEMITLTGYQSYPPLQALMVA
jgi:dihydrofolate reductase/thymidylate synthase